jgi:hypothetical protein
MNRFIFESYTFDKKTSTARFKYKFENGINFEEKIIFNNTENYNPELLDRALFLSFMLIGTSYYKTFPSPSVVLKAGTLDKWQVYFFDTVYQEGMSQFAYENDLKRSDLAHFDVSNKAQPQPLAYSAKGIIALQSGGKDSLLTASLLKQNEQTFMPWYISSSSDYPSLLNDLGSPVRTTQRQIDITALRAAKDNGGFNGHVPVTYILMALSLVDVILTNKSTVLLSIGHEGEEPHAWIDDLPVNHQWSKTWPAEQAFAEYVKKYISSDLRIGSPLRGYSELKIAELFVKHAWQKFGHSFSSCNLANYKQGESNATLKWCGECPKCANSFLLFAPFVEPSELESLFDGQDLFSKPSLQETFKGLLGIEGIMKPFECVGEINELRLAYHMARERWSDGYAEFPFEVPKSTFDYHKTYENQKWAKALITSTI